MAINGLSYYNGAEAFAKKLHGKGSFVLVMGYTETAAIPGITVAGAAPELMCYTPPLDAELVHTGRIITLDNIAMTSDAIPTPGLITRAAVSLSDFREYYVDAGGKISPFVPHFRVGNGPGADIRTGKAVPNAKQIIDNARKVGKEIAAESEYLVIGETTPAGTTTALAVLRALGVDTKNVTSSSMADNPQALKDAVVKEGLQKAGINGKCDALQAIEAVGDPMMAATIGLVQGAQGVPVILAGGTQMAVVSILISKMMDINKADLALSTTRWVAEDSTSSLFGILKGAGVNIPVIVSNLSFARSKYTGLLAYERGMVKEGVGAGGIAAATILKGVPKVKIEDTVEAIYSKMVGN
ncbi:MAG TPA: TIGR00303 family protein [Methanocella sp.]|uniref:nicotinate mononucleotide-dependent phosphoribosyltransferase CobT n=1 Tax=Methanocella sp. TaxID=2052833 RepID=UPI002B8C755A|nr:TIGR00303 family protein [Methanocella sp.]HTY91911.1 TIGR00303 family protein [Methanocella sp.]